MARCAQVWSSNLSKHLWCIRREVEHLGEELVVVLLQWTATAAEGSAIARLLQVTLPGELGGLAAAGHL